MLADSACLILTLSTYPLMTQRSLNPVSLWCTQKPGLRDLWSCRVSKIQTVKPVPPPKKKRAEPEPEEPPARTKNGLKPVRCCERSSKRFGHRPALRAEQFKENLFKTPERNNWLAGPKGVRYAAVLGRCRFTRLVQIAQLA